MRPLRDADTQVFGAMLGRRRQVVAILVAERNRLSRALPEVRPRMDAHINWLEQELDDLDRDLRRTVETNRYGGRETNCCAAFPE